MALICSLLMSLLVFGCHKQHSVDGGSLLTASSAESLEWYECERNEVPVSCIAEYLDSEMVVHWRDGTFSRLTCADPCEPNGLRIDEKGDSWQHELFIQGNSVYTNVHTGESIFIPLRLPSPRQ